MPLVNGNYVPDELPMADHKFWNKTGDWSDSLQAKYNFMLKQQEQAYNLELWNYMNEYNSPAAQMKRYQDAGLSPWLIYGQQNTAPAPQAASASTFRSSGTAARGMQAAMSTIGQIMNTVRAASETYDYLKYGRTQQSFRTSLIGAQAEAERLRNRWEYYLQGEDPSGVLPTSPRATMYRNQSEAQEQRVKQLEAIIKTIPDQQARTQALKALDDYRLEILRGQNDAILNINTGMPGLDSFLRLLGYWLIQK